MKKMNNMVKILIFCSLLLLTGCSGIREQVRQKMWERSGVEEDLSYIQYQQMEEAGALDAEGLYTSSVVEQHRLAAESRPEGSVRVSFARNDSLRFHFFRDERFSEPLETAGCRLDPGNAVYASEAELIGQVNPFYQFSRFLVFELDENGSIKRQLASVSDLPGEIYRIPDDFQGTDISIIPLGEYRDRTAVLSAVYVHPDGKRTALENGSWEINGKRYGNVSVKLNPMESYRISYDYGSYKEKWYFSSSAPEYYWEDSHNSTITFLSEPSEEEVIHYEVQLHPYGKLTIENGVTYQNMVDSFLDSAATIFGNKSVIETQNILSLVQVNGITAVNNFSDMEVSLPDLKAGDEILVRVPEDLKIISGDGWVMTSILTDAGREYRFTIPDAEPMDFHLTVSRRNSDADGVFHEVSVANGELAVYDPSGVRYKEGFELPADNEKVTVTITPDAEYCVYGKNIKDNVYRQEMKYSDFALSPDGIIADHPIRPGIKVTLDTDDPYGTCTFWTGNRIISGDVILREGQDLQFDYLLDPDAGFEIILTPEEMKEAINVWNPYAAERVLDVTEAVRGQTLRCRDYLTLKEGVKTNDLADPY